MEFRTERHPFCANNMSRQVGPSIVFSVLIVCFFAVALFQHDPPTAANGQAAAGDAILGPRPPAEGPAKAPPSGPIESARRRANLSPRFARSAPRGNASVSPAAPISTVDLKGRSAAALAERTSLSPPEKGATRTSRPRARSTAPAADTATTEPAETASRRSAFTIAQSAETIEDVALRVYGTTVEADALWRANRDALPRRDSPLVAGMLLRTPQSAR
jgi:hypothetical protein